MKQHIIELETRLAFQDNSLQQLNDIVTQQQQQLDRLQRQIEALHLRVEQMTTQQVIDNAHDNPPPHY